MKLLTYIWVKFMVTVCKYAILPTSGHNKIYTYHIDIQIYIYISIYIISSLLSFPNIFYQKYLWRLQVFRLGVHKTPWASPTRLGSFGCCNSGAMGESVFLTNSFVGIYNQQFPGDYFSIVGLTSKVLLFIESWLFKRDPYHLWDDCIFTYMNGWFLW